MLDMTPATIERLRSFGGDGRDFDGSYSLWLVGRSQAIRAARTEGHSLEAIGQALGISRQRVHQLLNSERGTRA
jgi:hypothetical protein